MAEGEYPVGAGNPRKFCKGRYKEALPSTNFLRNTILSGTKLRSFDVLVEENLENYDLSQDYPRTNRPVPSAEGGHAVGAGYPVNLAKAVIKKPFPLRISYETPSCVGELHTKPRAFGVLVE